MIVKLLEVHQVHRVIANWHSRVNVVPPFYLIYVTVIMLSRWRRTFMPIQFFPNA